MAYNSSTLTAIIQS
ncbi:uncharacterized protein FFB20_07479 [Fusarium fujikuroi]|nr:uncharacterized protein FFB20_07479 [Fusarium fujikuroi]